MFSCTTYLQLDLKKELFSESSYQKVLMFFNFN